MTAAAENVRLMWNFVNHQAVSAGVSRISRLRMPQKAGYYQTFMGQSPEFLIVLRFTSDELLCCMLTAFQAILAHIDASLSKIRMRNIFL